MSNDRHIERYILPVGGLLLLYFGGKALLEKFGVIQSAQGATNQGTLLPGSPLLPTYYKNYSGSQLLLTVAAADAYANAIYSAHGIFNDDEDLITGIFQNLKTKSQVSFLADRFQTIYGKSLSSFLSDILSEGEYGTIVNYVNALPARLA